MSVRRCVLVTGGASGIGEATAKCFAVAGDDVAIADVNEESGRAVAAAITARGGRARFYRTDVADAGNVDASVDRVLSDHGRIDVLVNSGGILQNATSTLTMDRAEAERIISINYFGTLFMCQSVGQIMKAAGRGVIVNMASMTSFRCSPQPAYGASKAAIIPLTESLAAELGPSGIRVNAVAPGYTLTPAMQARIDSGERDPQAVTSKSALGRFVMPEDVGDAIFFLCSEAATAITGITLPVDCGWLVGTSYGAYAARPEN
ncbi:MAG: SDR family NAD(P)-dependent oxidoreductase [Alphaproteobacteria bacterium]